MGIEERNVIEQIAADKRNKSGLKMALGGFCVIIITVAADSKEAITLCHCWTPLVDPVFLINAVGHVASALMIFFGAKKMDW